MRRAGFPAIWLLAAMIAAPVPAALTCFPTCAPDDGRFVVLEGGYSLSSLSALPLQFEIVPAAGAAEVEIGVFDGDSGAPDGLGTRHWDIGASPAWYTLRPCAARGCEAPGAPRAVFVSHEMPDNGWFPIHAEVRPGDVSFLLTIELDPATLTRVSANQLKVRASGEIRMGEAQQPFAFMSQYTGFADLEILFPRFELATWNDFAHHSADARYDGIFTFLQEVEVCSRASDLVLQLWNGDLDRGAWDGTHQDTDDADTPSGFAVVEPCPEDLLPPFYLRPDIPPFARTVVCSEGVAVGRDGGTGAPADEADPHYPLTGPWPGINRYSCRPPSVYVTHETPGGRWLTDPDPSGNREWERYCLAERDLLPEVAPGAGPVAPDARVDPLEAGLYRSRVVAMDHNNLAAWYCGCTALPDADETSPVDPSCSRPCHCTVVGTPARGCTPGYWKQPQHLANWTLYQPDDLFEDVFGVLTSRNPTLLEALRAGGGGESALLRHATAALLNAARTDVDFPYGLAEVISAVQAAFAGDGFETWKDLFTAANEAGCDLERAATETSSPRGKKKT